MQVGKILFGITVRGEGVGAAGDMKLLLNETLILLEIPYTRVNKRNSLLGAYWLLSACFFPGFAPG